MLIMLCLERKHCAWQDGEVLLEPTLLQLKSTHSQQQHSHEAALEPATTEQTRTAGDKHTFWTMTYEQMSKR